MRKLIFFIFFIPACNSNTQIPVITKKEFHIRVSCWHYDKWHIEFTNNNWFEKDDINSAFDISGGCDTFDVVHQLELNSDKNILVAIANKLDTYEKCLKYNDSVKVSYDNLVVFRKTHPIKRDCFADKEDEKDCTDCPSINIH
jgi:hypothetical protein